ncbi:Zn(II)2Cys6 transcription factor [Aspergillus foveolatus]|uniref:Zn(II)2Cys6 transcription factor n=1 Tax=Aspergillus foveolatus TaxID=210207 RepID=UPI003CCD16A2
MSSQSSGDLTLSQPRRHIIKACEGCRQQKIKCNGKSPCERCARLSLPCTVRTVARQRRQKILQKKAQEDDVEIIQTALRPVRITDRATGRSAVYGPTSTIALLHLLAAKKDNYAISVEVSSTSLVHTDLCINRLKLNSLAHQPYTIPPMLGLSLTPPLCLTTIPNQILQFFLNREIGNFDKAYALLGPTASKIYAAGFHLEPRGPEVEKLIHILVGVEQFICIALGRPPILGPGIQVSHENESTDAKFFTGLFAILSPSLRAQNNPATSFDELWHSIWTTQARLKAYWEEYEPLLRTAQTEPHRPWNLEDTMRLNTNLYEYAVLTNMKPFLLYMGQQSSALSRAASPASQSSGGMGVNTGALTITARLGGPFKTANDNAKMASATECILASAKNIISTISELRQGCSDAKDLPMHSFFLEAACISLIAYGAWSNNQAAVWDSIELGVRCMEQLQYQRAAAQRLATVRAAMEQTGLKRQL